MERIRAYAKVNIGLLVGGRRPDGYHDIDSFFLRVPIYDEIEIDAVPSSEASVTIRGNESYMGEGGMDLMEKSARAYMKEASLPLAVSIAIEKHIPSKAGLGGGSSDAAAVLLYLERTCKVLGKEKLMALAARLGADMPFFVSGHTLSRVGGIGERLEERDASLLDYRYITFYRRESVGVSTREAYETLDRVEREERRLPEIQGKVSRRDYPNDFERIGYLPVLDTLREKYGDRTFWSLSGSGDVAFVLSDGKIEDTDQSYLVSLPLDL